MKSKGTHEDSSNFQDDATEKALLKRLATSMGREELIAFLLSHAEKTGLEKFRTQATEEIMRITKPADVVPDIYREYRQIVHDGIRFLLSALSPERLTALVAEQLLINEDAAVEERLIRLARQIPTLHKLGQIIARNRHMAPSFRNWLIQLENDVHGADIAGQGRGLGPLENDLHRTDITGQGPLENDLHGDIAEAKKKIDEELGDLMDTFSIRTDDHVLAQASVGEVVAFTWMKPDSGSRAKGVFKLPRPGVKERLEEELRVLDQMAVFFKENRERYTLRDFRFVETFRDVKVALQKEVDFSGEQRNLRRASLFYDGEKLARIPQVLPFSTPNLTAMEFVDGGKITDVPLGLATRKTCAQSLFATVIGHPLFSHEERTPFHGDPHAGNIFACEGKDQGNIEVALLDWSQTGYLSKEQRMNLLRLAIGVIIDDEGFVCEAMERLSIDDSTKVRRKIRKIVRDVVITREYAESSLVKRAFLLIDQSAVRGIGFSSDLLLFRKAFFTLEGVLYDLDPGFDMDVHLMGLVADIFMQELPKRWMYLFFPHSDRPEYYKTLISNDDLHMIGVHIFMEIFEKGAAFSSVLMEKNAEFLSRAFCMAR